MFSLHQYDPLWIFLSVSISIPYLASSISGFVAPTRKEPEKLTSYESGIEPKGSTSIQFQICYYMFASVFTVSDVETLFLYPRAVSFRELGLFAFVEVVIFIFILVVGLVHAWRKGASEWCQLPNVGLKVR
uniref:NAD(P)H-quinone oxidoreductase subunit 3, chloroplastic n=1 Tax=Lepisorus fortuni TaxID=272675 RepID=A0A7T1FUY4_9MONI|nr:NADH-plastoquinone oxidoreductase subunit 3 [Neolepisorus fortunei]QPM99693.1 NADH-plastoquinone oxidoreductase subunit 3 [Neolepisorus fortunei]